MAREVVARKAPPETPSPRCRPDLAWKEVKRSSICANAQISGVLQYRPPETSGSAVLASE